MAYSTICCLGGSTNLTSPSRAISEELRIAYRERFKISDILTQLEISAGIKPQGTIPPITHAEDDENSKKYQESGSSKDRSGFRPIKLGETDLDERVNQTIKGIIAHFSSPPSQEEIRIVENNVWGYKLGFRGLGGGLIVLAVSYLGMYYFITLGEHNSTIKQR